MSALARHLPPAPIAPLGLCPDLRAVEAVLCELEQGQGACDALDAAIYAALGWVVTTDRYGARRRLAWRCRSPLGTSWDLVPSPTGRQDDAARLVPFGWDYGAGITGGLGRGWCRERRVQPGQHGPRFFETNRATPARALASAALFAVRYIAMEGR